MSINTLRYNLFKFPSARSTSIVDNLITPRPAATIRQLSLTSSPRFGIRNPVSARFFTVSTTVKMGAQKANGDTSSSANEEWKQRPPYSVHTGDGFKARYEASCHCGKVKYELSREVPLDSKLCHCTTCQTQHAAPFQWAAIFHKEDINFTNGHHDLEWYDPTEKSIEHKLPCKVRCSYCHSPIMDEGRNMVLLFPSLVHFQNDQEKKNFKPRMHMFYSQRVMDIPDGLPKWSGINEKSELIEDSPQELVKELERKRVKEQNEETKK